MTHCYLKSLLAIGVEEVSPRIVLRSDHVVPEVNIHLFSNMENRERTVVYPRGCPSSEGPVRSLFTSSWLVMILSIF